MDTSSAKQFEEALLKLGSERLRLDQLIAAYTQTFPSEALQADMRQRLHDAIDDLWKSGFIYVPQDAIETYQGAELPTFVLIQERGLLN